MAGENKQLGTLQLNTGGVLQAINEVNAALQKLGKGVDLDLTKIVNSKVSGELANLKKQIEDVTKAATGQTPAEKKALDNQLRILETQASVARAYGKQRQQQEKEYSDWFNTELSKREKMELASLEMKSADARKIAQEQQKIQEWYNNDSIQRRKSQIEEESKITMDGISKRMEAEKRAIDEQSKYQAQYDKESLERRQQESKITIDSIQARMKAEQQAYESSVQQATQLYKEQIDIQKRLASGTAGENETAVLQQQLAEKQAAFAQYGRSIQDAAKADASVVKAQQDLMLTQAQATDRAQKEQSKAAEEAARKSEELQRKWRNTLISVVGAASLAILKHQWSAAIEYATTYYDKLNEIRVVTGKTETEATKMGQEMRDLAKKMKVTSTELSQAAVTFYRQGLNDAQVKDRLKWVTEYAKVANIDFEEAAQLMTAAINTMGDSIEGEGFVDVVEHVADVFLYLGDNAATSGEEIGKAMQKASASATEFGLSFEWLGAYIATVSEQTRQAPESIGNAFNTMLARMHQIKATGFNNDDTTKLNDVAKALATINVELMDSDGNWRDMSAIYEDISKQWSDLDAKQRAYLATTMAGVRQQNVFYALMNDLSKGLEDGSRAWELYYGAMDSAGTATKKYSVWQESIAASQANMTNSLEQLYSNLQPNLIKLFYDAIALLAGGLNNLGGVIPVVISGITALIVVIRTATAIANPLVSMMLGAATILGSLGIMGVIGAPFSGIETSVQKYASAIEKISEADKKLTSLESAKTGLSEMLASVQSDVVLSADGLKKYNSQLDTVASISPTAEAAVRQLTDGYSNQAGVLATLIDKTNEAIAAELAYQALVSRDALSNYTNSDSYSEQKDITLRGTYNKTKDLMGSGFSAQRYAQEAGGTLMVELAKGIASGWINENDEAEIEAAIENYFIAYETKLLKAAQSEAQNVISNVISSLGKIVTSGQKAYLGEAILNMLVGDDGQLDYEDVSEKRIREIFVQLMSGAEEALNNVKGQFSFYKKKIGEYGLDVGMFGWMVPESEGNTINVEAAEIIYSLLEVGATVEQVNEAFAGTSNVNEFIEKLTELQSAVKTTNDTMTGEEGNGEDTASAVKTYIDSISKASTLIDKIKSLQDQIAKGESLSLSDMLDVAEANPEIIMLTNNLGALTDKLKLLEETQKQLIKDNIVGILKDSEEAFSNSKYAAQGQSLGITTFSQLESYYKSDAYKSQYGEQGAKQSEMQLSALEKYLLYIADGFMNATEAAENFETPFEKLLADIEKLNKAKDALDVILHPEDNDASKLASAWNDILIVFPQLKAETATVEDVQNATEGLEDSVRSAAEGFGDLGQTIIQSMTEGTQSIRLLSEEFQDSFFPTASQEGIASYIKKFFAEGNVDWTSRKRITPEQMLEYGWEDIAGNTYATKFGKPMSAYVGDKQYVVNVTPILPDGKILSEEGLYAYVNEISDKAQAMGMTLLEADAVENGGKGLLYYVAEVTGELDDAINVAEIFDMALSRALAEYDNRNLSTLLNGVLEDIENAKLALNGYKDIIDSMISINDEEGANGVVNKFTTLSDSVQSGFVSEYQDLALAMNEFNEAVGEYDLIAARVTETEEEEIAKTQELARAEEKLVVAQEKVDKEFSKIQRNSNIKYFKDTAKSLDKLEKGTVNVADAYADFYKESEKAVTAQSEYLTALDAMADGSEVAADDVKNLADFLGFLTPDALLENWDQVGPLLSSAIDEGIDALNRLNEAAFINITGTSEADFSAIQNGLIATQGMAEDTVNALLATGQWTVETLQLNTKAWVQGANGKWSLQTLTGYQQILKPSGSNPLGKAKSSYKGGGSSGGGGGGGGGNSSKGMTEVERMLDRMAQIQDIQDHTKSLYSAQASLYAQTGQLQGVIRYYEKERDAIEAQNKTLQENIDEMEPWLEKKKAEVAALDVSSAEYAEASSDLKSLQERHQQYTLALINNTAEVDKLTKAIKEQNDAIRQMEIDLRSTILGAIKDREELNERMLEGTVKTEDTILELIQKRYEKERDLILANTQKQIDALEKEKDLLSEQLELRKQQAEEEDKLAKLAELEAKYARISADPTRRKEALSIEKEIADLRDEISWDLAEKEVKAQQDSIDQQIESLEDYSTYIENYYEDLFTHPKKLIEEMKQIIIRTDEEILNWLKENDESYAEATEATKETTLNGWKDMLRDMRGELELFWDEVEKIMSGGEDGIIEFLKENSADYREAGQLEAEAYVDEWKKQLEDLKKAKEAVVGGAEPSDYVYIAPAEGSSSGGGGGSGGSGGGSSSKSATNTTTSQGTRINEAQDIVATITDKGAVFSVIDPVTGKLDTVATAKNIKADAKAKKAVASNSNSTESQKKGVSYISFDTGGMTSNEGLAYVHNKERILNPYQTELFESLVESLYNLDKILIPSMPFIDQESTSAGSSVNVGDIIVNVDKMDTDADYEEMAEKVFNTLMERINRGSIVGGIRFAR